MEFDLQRFLDRQAETHTQAMAELRAGHKQSHWIWWEFPQRAGLGTSEYSRIYGIVSDDEALAFLDHDVLFGRLDEGVEIVHDQVVIRRTDATRLMGSSIDVTKLRSSLELFGGLAKTLAGEPYRRFAGRADAILAVIE